MQKPDEKSMLTDVLRGQVDAVVFCQSLFRVSQIIDDLHDQDRPVTSDTLKQMAWIALVELPSNPFYQKHFAALQPLVRMSLMDWLDSTVLEQGSLHDQSLAFVLRDSLTGVVSQCAYLIGGYAWMCSISPTVRRFFHDETLTDYMAGLEPEKSKPAEQKEQAKTATKTTTRKQPAKRQQEKA